MNYSQALEFIHSRIKFGSRPGMERIEALCAEFENPQDDLKFVHVAGTNGKGSTCVMTAEILKAAGYRVGLFTSPYITDFRERIQINSEMISENDLTEIVEEIVPAVEKLDGRGIQATEFEIITVAAFLYFLRQNCDIVVLETGLGGTLDSTNIIKKSEVSVITSVSMDHEAILGDTLLKIAEHKCGIIKENGRVVSYPQPDFAVERLIKEKAKQKNCEYTGSELAHIRLVRDDISGSVIIYSGCTFKIPLTGKHQIYNFSTVAAAINVLKGKGWEISLKNMIDGVANTKIPARVEIAGENPLTIIDGGHNPEGVDSLCDTLKKYCGGKKIIAVLAMMKDKNYSYCVSRLAPLCSRVYATAADLPRSLDPKILADTVKPYCSKVKAVESYEKAYYKAMKKADSDDVVLICGSLYLASDIKKLRPQK